MHWSIFGELKERILNFFILSDGKFYLKDKERKELNKENVKQRLKRKNLKEIKLNFHSKIKEKNLWFKLKDKKEIEEEKF